VSANEKKEVPKATHAVEFKRNQRGAGQPEGTERHGRQKGRGAVDPDLPTAPPRRGCCSRQSVPVAES